MDKPFVISLLFVLGLLLVGFVLRAGVRPLRLLFVPASVIGGLLGLAVMQAGLRIGPGEITSESNGIGFQSAPVNVPDEYASAETDEEVIGWWWVPSDGGGGEYFIELGSGGPPLASTTQIWSATISNVIDGWPGLLIAVVFAGLLMERPGKRFGEAAARAGRQGIFVWIIGIGEAFVGLLACALLIAPFYDVPPVFGQLIEAGFIGGHGTAAAMGTVMNEQFGFAPGRDLAFLFATIGLVYGVLSGIVFVNLGVRRGWLRGGPTKKNDIPDAEAAASDRTLDYAPNNPNPVTRGDFEIPVVSGLENRKDPQPTAWARVRSEVIDPFAFQLCLLGLAFAVGYAMQQFFLWLAGIAAPPEWQGYIGNIPLFLFTLIGGWLTREAMHVVGVGDLIDPPSINRITGLAMEILIVAALATLRIEAAAEFLVPVLILLAVGFVWTALCLLVIARRVLPRDYWFELGLMNYGMSTATTAQGILLLRIVDRDLDTGAAEDYAAAAPLSAPFIGGGVITVLGLPLALSAAGYWPVLGVMAVVLAGLIAGGVLLGRRERLS